MRHLLLRRLAWTLPVLLAVTVIGFLLMHAMPGSPRDTGPGDPLALPNTGRDAITRATLERAATAH